jgi:hypothetical protein
MLQNLLLFTSALRDDTNALEQALGQEEKERERQGLDVNMRAEKTGSTALRMAVGGGNINSVRILLRYGADPNIGDNRGGTPLQSIVVKCKDKANKNKAICFEIAELLLQAGADPDAKNKYNETPFSFVKDGITPDEKCMKALLERYRKQPDLTAVEPVAKKEDSEIMPAPQKAEKTPSVPPRKSKSWPSTEREANLDENAGDDAPLLSSNRYGSFSPDATNAQRNSGSEKRPQDEDSCTLVGRTTYLPQPSFFETVTSMFFGQPKSESEDTLPLRKPTPAPKLKKE